MNELKIVRLAFEAEVFKDAIFPGFLGNTIRGALGNALVKSFCKRDEPHCKDCPVNADCVYATMFKSVYADAQFATAPNPFTMNVPYDHQRAYRAGEKLAFDILLFGNAVRWHQEIIHAVNRMFEGDFAGKGRCVNLLRAVDGYSGKTLFAQGVFLDEPEVAVWSDEYAETLETITEVEIEFVTPVQILKNRRLITGLDFSAFIDHLFWRISSMIDIYGEREFIVPYSLLFRKPYIETTESVSKRIIKQEKQSIEGLVGKVRYRGNLTRYMPYIDLGSQLHIGKLTTRGCGEYRFEIKDPVL